MAVIFSRWVSYSALADSTAMTMHDVLRMDGKREMLDFLRTRQIFCLVQYAFSFVCDSDKNTVSFPANLHTHRMANKRVACQEISFENFECHEITIMSTEGMLWTNSRKVSMTHTHTRIHERWKRVAWMHVRLGLCMCLYWAHTAT